MEDNNNKLIAYLASLEGRATVGMIVNSTGVTEGAVRKVLRCMRSNGSVNYVGPHGTFGPSWGLDHGTFCADGTPGKLNAWGFVVPL